MKGRTSGAGTRKLIANPISLEEAGGRERSSRREKNINRNQPTHPPPSTSHPLIYSPPFILSVAQEVLGDLVHVLGWGK